MRTILFPLVALSLLATAPAAEETPTQRRPNVVLIAIDDLNDWVGCLGGHPNASSPNIDRLALRGTLFANAHCQAPICNPSRTSVMYGLRPSSSGVYMNSPKPWTVAALKNRVTLPRHFAAHGYRTYTTGKIYHGSGLPPGDFDVVGPRPGQRLKIDARLIPETPAGAKGLWDFGGQTYDQMLTQDYADASWAIDAIEHHDPSQPFFMAIGFYRPHVPFYSPIAIFNEIPAAEIKLPLVKADDRDDLPAIVDRVTIAPAAPSHQWFVRSGNWKPAVQAYLACIRWTDHQVGRLLETIDRSGHADDTIIVLYSDHGFFLGEKQRWAKQSLWERATHVPLIIAAPGMRSNQRCDQPVELLSIYPTLAELCRLPQLPGVEGVSLRPLLQDATAAWPHVALTTHGQGNHAVRTTTHRYIRYRDGSEELYDLSEDPHEWNNLIAQGGRDDLTATLAKHLPATNAPPAKSIAAKKKQP